MNDEKFTEIRNNLYKLSGLDERLKKLMIRIDDAEKDAKSMLRKYQAEALDVEQLKKESLSSTILRLVGRYEGKLNKEIQEALDAKLSYDKASSRIKELYHERDELTSRISSLRQDKQRYELELERRENALRSGISGEKSLRYRELENEREMLYKEMVEVDEAIGAANKAKETAKRIMKHLDSADNWATYDVWFKGGIISHMAKYSHIDDAEADFNRLSSQMKDLQSELKDIKMSRLPEISGIDSTTRAIDYWFDNIFTDLNVRSRIRDDKDQAYKLVGMIQSIITKLEGNRSTIRRQLASIEDQKNDLILG